MSDQQSEVNPASPEVESVNGSFSTNGNDPGATASTIDGSGGHDLSFLDDLAKAMRTTAAAEQARDAELTDQRRQAHLDAIRAREALEAEELRELAKEDVKGIDAWSDGEIKRIKLERERRIASRREQLQVRLEEHRLVIASEVEAVEAALAAYRVETERFFDRIGARDRSGRDRTPGGHAPAVPGARADRPAGGDPSRGLPGPRLRAALLPAARLHDERHVRPGRLGRGRRHERYRGIDETGGTAEVAEPVEAIAETETVDAPESVEAAAIAEIVETPEPVVAEDGDPNQPIAVMDPEAGQAPAAAPWEPSPRRSVSRRPPATRSTTRSSPSRTRRRSDGPTSRYRSVPRRAWSCRARPAVPDPGSAGRTARPTGPTRADNRRPSGAWRPSSR